MTPRERPHTCHRAGCRHRGHHRHRGRRRVLTVPAAVALIQLLGAVLRLFGG